MNGLYFKEGYRFVLLDERDFIYGYYKTHIKAPKGYTLYPINQKDQAILPEKI